MSKKHQGFNVEYDSSIEDIINIYQQFQQRNKQDQRALCCLLGSYAGDNLGNYNEFQLSITQSGLDEALQMNGKGCHNLLPGQSTDDTELATSLGYGLIESQRKGIINLDMIAKYYSIWFNSPPFDIGGTTANAFQPLRNFEIDLYTNYNDYVYESLALKLKASSYQKNQDSKSNGGLMRISPLIVYLSKLNNQDSIKKAVYEEQTLTHSNETALECSYIFVRACIQLIQTGSAQETFYTINNYVQNECKVADIKNYWAKNVLQKQKTKAIDQQGFIMHAFTQSFIILNELVTYESQSVNRKQIYQFFIRTIIEQCGDSDTNAAICGALLGSYLCLDEFPNDYIKKIIYCNLQDTSQKLLKNPRKPIYNPRNCIYLCQKLLEYGPSPENNLLIFPLNIDELKKTYKLQQINTPMNKQDELYMQNKYTEKIQNTEITIDGGHISQTINNIKNKNSSQSTNVPQQSKYYQQNEVIINGFSQSNTQKASIKSNYNIQQSQSSNNTEMIQKHFNQSKQQILAPSSNQNASSYPQTQNQSNNYQNQQQKEKVVYIEQSFVPLNPNPQQNKVYKTANEQYDDSSSNYQYRNRQQGGYYEEKVKNSANNQGLESKLEQQHTLNQVRKIPINPKQTNNSSFVEPQIQNKQNYQFTQDKTNNNTNINGKERSVSPISSNYKYNFAIKQKQSQQVNREGRSFTAYQS